MTNIDLMQALHRTDGRGYSDLVTRSTGRAVRGQVERALLTIDPNQLTVIDFGAVDVMDFSCADEIVAKTLLAWGPGRYFLLRGVSHAHMEAIEAVLERHGLAIVAEDRSGEIKLLGPLRDVVKRAFTLLMKQGSAHEHEVVESLEDSADSVREALEELRTRHLVYFTSAGYSPLTTA